jgi:hypothetical protein
MIKRSLAPVLTILTLCSVSLLGACAPSSGNTGSTGPRNSQGQVVDPQTGIPLPGETGGRGMPPFG